MYAAAEVAFDSAGVSVARGFCGESGAAAAHGGRAVACGILDVMRDQRGSPKRAPSNNCSG
jgi:hypothetical protein